MRPRKFTPGEREQEPPTCGKKLAQNNISSARTFCWPSTGPEFLPACPFPCKDTKHVAIKVMPQSTTAAIKLLLSIFLPQDEITQITLWLQKKVRGRKKSTGATTCCKSSKDTFISHTVPFPFLGGVSCWLPCFLSPPSYQDYYNHLIIPFCAVEENISHLTKCFRKLSFTFKRWLSAWNTYYSQCLWTESVFPKCLNTSWELCHLLVISHFIFWRHGGLHSSEHLCKIEEIHTRWTQFTEQV